MEGLYEEFWGEGVFEQEDVERSSACGESMPCAPNRSLFGRALTRITTLYHPFDLAEAGIDVPALLSGMSEEKVLGLIEAQGVELSITPAEALYLLEQGENAPLRLEVGESWRGASIPQLPLGTRDDSARTPRLVVSCGAEITAGVDLAKGGAECSHAHNGGRRNDASLVSAC